MIKIYSVHYLLEIDHKVKILDQIKYFIVNISFKHTLDHFVRNVHD